MYLNSIYFGEGSFGIQDAAQTYFGKSAGDLTLAESSFLIGIIPSPSRLSPYNGDIESAKSRQKKLLAQMFEFESITKSEYEKAVKDELIFRNNNENANNIAPHFALMVRDSLIKKYGEEKIIRSGYIVKTTLNMDWQEYAEVSIKNHVDRLAANQVKNASMVAMDPKTGEIKSLVGSADWANEENGKVNMAIAPRQPGSSFKPIVYAKAFEDRIITPATVLKDEPITFRDSDCPSCPSYTPGNYDGKFRGNVLTRRALANSLNIPSVEVMQKVGIEKTLQKAKDLGIESLNQSPSNYGLSLILGSGEVPLLNMVQVYSSFANKGEEPQIKLFTEIKNKKHEIIFTSENTPKRVWPVNVTYLISSILSDRSARAETFGSALNISRTAAVKTGTTNDYKDAWTIGYTPDLVVGVWVGNNDNAPMDRVAGSLGAAPIWRDMMEKFNEGTPSKEFEKPTDLVQLSVCRSSGLRAKSASASAYLEYFIPGTEPTKGCIDEPKEENKQEDKKEDEEKLKEILDRIDNDQKSLLEEIQRRREERRGRFKNRD
jgi:membrane peptidoglycan carboxypeptidase